MARTLPEDPQVRFAFSERSDGNVSLIVGEGSPGPSRAALLAALGLSAHDAVYMRQVHGAGVARVGAADRGRGVEDHSAAVADVDALVTSEPDVALVVLAADCVPVLLAAPGTGVAAVHAGRGGVAAGVVAEAVAALEQGAGAQAERVGMVAVLGPAVGGCCYEVPADLAEKVAATAPAARATSRAGNPSLDLPAAVVAQLRDSGVTRVVPGPGCTRCDPGRWFSHRATVHGWPHGRQAGAIARLASGPAPERSGVASLH